LQQLLQFFLFLLAKKTVQLTVSLFALSVQKASKMLANFTLIANASNL
jgi:hypothetical protein